jgi:IclR family transcriptional regulator, acetate operon repressor
MTKDSEAQGVQSVERALRILEHLARQSEGARLSDLARGLGLAVSTTHRLLTTLEKRGFAQASAESGLWHVGRRAYFVGSAYGRRVNYAAVALPYLRRLRDATRETANLGVLDDGEVITVAQVESREIMRAIAPPGGRAPVINSAMGKAMIAAWPDAAILDLIRRNGLQPLTATSLMRPEAVLAEIARIRLEGYAVDDEEFLPGMRCVAAAVLSAEGEPLFAISISGLAARVTQDRIARCGQTVRLIAQQLAATLMGEADA